MSDEMKVQTKGFNKKFLFVAIALVAVGLVVALVLWIPTSSKAKRVEEQLDLGAKYLSELDYEQAIVAYKAVIKIDPKCEEAYLALADVYIAMGEFDKAEEVLKQAEETIGDDVADAVAEKRSEMNQRQTDLNRTESTPMPVPTSTPTPTLTNEPTPSQKPTQAIVLNWENMLDYRVEGNQTVTIVKLSNTQVEEVIIPNEIDGYPVCKIGVGAFDNCDNLSRLELPDSLRAIGGYALHSCDSLEQLFIPSNVEIIEESAIRLCSSLKEISVDENNAVYTANGGALFDQDMKTLLCVPAGYTAREYSIPDGVTRIGEAAFDGCNMDVIHIPESLQQIGDQAFLNCYNLKEITIPKNVSGIGEISVGAQVKVNVDIENEFYMVEDGVLFNKDKTRLLSYGSEATKYKLPDAVEQIDSFAFDGSGIEEIELHGNLKSIGDQGFICCYKLVSIVVPGKIDRIAVQTFAWCDSLERVELLEGVMKIGTSAFQGCSNLQEVVIPASVTQIATDAFEGSDSVVIYTPAGSYAEQWAKENGISVVVQ